MDYLPGWWDTIGQSATGFVDKLQRAVSPNHYAEEAFKKAAQQNPELITQIANMTPDQRQQAANAFGYKGQNPFAQMAVGNDLQKQIDLRAAKTRVASRPGGQDVLDAVATGTPTAKTETQQDTLFGLGVQKSQADLAKSAQDQKIGEITIQLNTGKLKDFNRAQADMDAAFESYPTTKGMNIGKMAIDAAEGRPVDPVAIRRLTADPGASQLFELAVKTHIAKIDDQARYSIASINKEGKQDIAIRAMQQMDAADKNLLNGLIQEKSKIQFFSPGAQTQSTKLDKEIDEIRERIVKRSEAQNLILQGLVNNDPKVRALVPPPATGQPGPLAQPAPPAFDFAKYGLTPP
jgi:hypothetical protein